MGKAKPGFGSLITRTRAGVAASLFALGAAWGAAAEPEAADRTALVAPILFCKRFNYQGLHIYDTFYQWRPGGGLYVLENPADPPERHRVRPVIDPSTAETPGEGVYFDPALSYDAKKLLFCFKGSETGASAIFEIGTDGRGLRRITRPDAVGNPYRGRGGGHHDVKPCYLPDGRIAFTSTRYSGLVPCANNGVAILHAMNADGGGIQALSVNNVTEFDPCVLPDGRILFGRWEYVDRNALVIQSLWTMLPDGRHEMEYFANNMVFPEAVLQAKPVPGHDGLVVATFAPHNAPPRGTIAMIDARIGRNDPAAIFNFESPDRPTHDRGESCDPWALGRNVVLFSGVPPDTNAPAIPVETPGFRRRSNPRLNALLLIDRAGRREVVHSDPAIDLHNPIPLAPRPRPVTGPDLADRTQRTGRFFVNDVHVSMPEVPRGTVKWLRVLEETSRVSESPGGTWMNQTFSISAALAWSAKIFHGIVPVEPDGSVYFEAPSGRALYFQLLDGDYRLVRGMRTFVQAAPGTTRSCTGCHEYGPTSSAAPRPDGRELRRLRDESWGGGYLDYTERVQPILDARCVSCHGGEKGLAAGLDLSRGWTEFFNISYEHLTARRERMYTADLIGGICAMNGTAHWSCKVFGPYSHGSGRAILADVLLREPHRNLLSREEREQVFAWMDSNGLYFGTWDYTQAGPRSRPFLDAVDRVKAVMKDAGCVRCHADAKGEILRFDSWINLDRPEMSRVLRAPLPASASAEGGYGLALCRGRPVDPSFSRKGLIYGFGYAHGVKELDSFPTQTWPTTWPPEGAPVTSFASTVDPHYRRMLEVIRDARSAQLAAPRVDMPGAEWVGGGIREGRSRQMLPQPLPDPLPGVRASVDGNGFVRLDWERSARMIGLIAEVHRGETAGFEPGEATRIGRTERFGFSDTNAPPGTAHYAVVFVSDPAETCGTCKSGAVVTFAGDQAGATAAAPDPTGCPLSTFEPRRGDPVRVAVEVPGALPAIRAGTPRTEPLAGRVRLRWAEAGMPGLTTYDVYGQAADGPPEPPRRLNREPLRGTTFVDAIFHAGREVRYAVVAHAPRRPAAGVPPPGEGWATARAMPPRTDPLFTLESAAGELQLSGDARLENGTLDLSRGGFATLPASDGRVMDGPFSFAMDARFDEAGQMPVLLGFGAYNGAGWFLQKIGGRWRFYLSGVSCDGGTVPLGTWVHLLGVYDGRSARLYQDGKLVAEAEVPAPPTPHGPVFSVGQYTAAGEAPYQFKGAIRNLALYDRALDADGR